MDVSDVVAQQLAGNDRAEAQAGADEVRRQSSEWLLQWGHDGVLPKGLTGDAMECVFANALGGCWDGATWMLPEDRLAFKLGYEEVELPSFVKDFIARFDGGEYPDLELARE